MPAATTLQLVFSIRRHCKSFLQSEHSEALAPCTARLHDLHMARAAFDQPKTCCCTPGMRSTRVAVFCMSSVANGCGG
jgi:hypothetical protein